MFNRRALWLLCTLMVVMAGAIMTSGGEAQAAEGRVYRGRWQSQSTGHSGPMRVRVTPRGPGQYDARFSGRFMLIVPFTYKVSMFSTASSSQGQWLSASKRLGPLMGGYSMTALMAPYALSGSFSAAGDTGQINMVRVR